MLIPIHPTNPQERAIAQVAKMLNDGAVIIFPTDTIYAIGCLINQSRAFERLCSIRGVQPRKAKFSFLLNDLSELSTFTRPFDRNVFKLLKASLPGPFTFILPASSAVPVLFRNNRKAIGIRIPDNKIVSQLIAACGEPLVSASLRDDADTIAGYLTDPEEIHERFGNLVDAVVDGGYGNNTASTVVDCTGKEPVVIREGLGQLPA